MSMDPEVKRKWVEALRSGEYQQGNDELRTADDRFCCIGVLADLQGRVWRVSYDADHGAPYYIGADSSTCRESEQAGLSWEDACKLAQMNDAGSTFSEIADYIERHL